MILLVLVLTLLSLFVKIYVSRGGLSADPDCSSIDVVDISTTRLCSTGSTSRPFNNDTIVDIFPRIAADVCPSFCLSGVSFGSCIGGAGETERRSCVDALTPDQCVGQVKPVARAGVTPYYIQRKGVC